MLKRELKNILKTKIHDAARLKTIYNFIIESTNVKKIDKVSFCFHNPSNDQIIILRSYNKDLDAYLRFGSINADKLIYKLDR